MGLPCVKRLECNIWYSFVQRNYWAMLPAYFMLKIARSGLSSSLRFLFSHRLLSFLAMLTLFLGMARNPGLSLGNFSFEAYDGPPCLAWLPDVPIRGKAGKLCLSHHLHSG